MRSFSTQAIPRARYHRHPRTDHPFSGPRVPYWEGHVGGREKRQPVCRKATTITVMRLNSLIKTTTVEKLLQAPLYSGRWVENQSGLGAPWKLSGNEVQRHRRQPK